MHVTNPKSYEQRKWLKLICHYLFIVCARTENFAQVPFNFVSLLLPPPSRARWISLWFLLVCCGGPSLALHGPFMVVPSWPFGFPRGSLVLRGGSSLAFPRGSSLALRGGPSLVFPHGSSLALPRGSLLALPHGPILAFPCHHSLSTIFLFYYISCNYICIQI